MIPIALYGDRSYNSDTIRKYMISGNNIIPGSSTIHFDEISKERIFHSIDKIRGIRAIIRENYMMLKNRLGRIPYLLDFYENGEIDPLVLIREYKTYQDFLCIVEPQIYKGVISEQEKVTLEYLCKTVLSGVRPYELEILKDLFEKESITKETFVEKMKQEYLIENENAWDNAIYVLEGHFVSNKEEYEKFWNELVSAEVVELHQFEKSEIFEGCMPVEVMAKRGVDTLRYGPLKPMGFTDPRTGYRPYAVVQLRQDNEEGTLYNMVGFQTNLKFGEQKRVFSMIPGLENAEFMKYGVMHRNTFINSTKLLDNTYNLKSNNNIFFAGQITGVEGYVESISSGLVAGINAANMVLGESKKQFSKETVIGALAKYISTENEKFQPMNANFGILPELDGEKIRDKKLRYTKLADRALENI